MKKYLVLLALLIAGTGDSYSATITRDIAPPASLLISPPDPLQYFSTLSMKKIQQLAGRKLKLKEKIAVKILQWKIKKGLRLTPEDPKTDKGKTAMIFGIIAIPLLFVPVIGPFAALISAILAIVIGYSARKSDPDNTKAKIGIVLGWVTIGLFVVAIAIAIAVLSSLSWG